MKLSFTSIFTIILSVQLLAQDPYATASVLKEGIFYKAPINKSGVHSLSAESLSKIIGSSVGDMSKVQIFSTPGSALIESTKDVYVDDLIEIPTILDGSTLIFYVEGGSTITYDNETQNYTRHTNPYDRENYIFIRTDGRSPQRILKANQPTTSEYMTSDYDRVQLLDKDNINLLHAAEQYFGTGREWYMERLDNKKNYAKEFELYNIVPGSNVHIKARAALRCRRSGRFTLNIGENQFSSHIGNVSLSNSDGDYAKAGITEGIFTFESPSTPWTLDILSSANDCLAWLDYIQATTRVNAILDESQKMLMDKNALQHETAVYRLSGATTRILEVSDLGSTQEYSVVDGKLPYTVENKMKRFVSFTTNNLIPITNGTRVKNQNLHGITNTEMILLYHPKFKESAQKLAKHRSTHDNMQITMVDVTEVYNEFSGGQVDPTAIRNFCRMVWKRDNSLKHVLLFGDATFDYRHIYGSVPHDNYIPAYETKAGLDPISNYPSDDYYAALENPEGRLSFDTIQLSIGRLPVTDINNAKALVNKIIHYDTNNNRYGKWRSHMTFVADDEDYNDHMESAEEISQMVNREHNEFNTNKIYFDAFKQIPTPGGDRYPAASQDINRKVQNGQLVVCYFGHGGPQGWAQERVLKKSDVDTWTNYDNMPLLVTATCTFAGYDDPTKVSAGEYCLQKEDGGAIALMTTVRPVYGSQNEALTRAVFDTLLGKNINGNMAFGEVMKYAKNKLKNNQNSQRFTLLGDPSQKLSNPEYNIVLTTVNGKDLSTETDTLSAFEKTTISGHIHDENNEIFTSFNGTVDLTIFDKKSELKTLGNDKSTPLKFSAYKNIVFRGSSMVENGKFSISFVVPKDINYEIGRGRVSMYAYTETMDAIGYNEDIYIGGTSSEAVVDDKGPEISVYMDNRQFTDGQSVSRFPVLIADFKDDVGINVSGSSIGHDITAVFNQENSQPFILNDYYTAARGDYTRGSIAIPVHHLSPGTHTVRIKAWDTANNSGEKSITFIIPDRNKAEVSCVASPNPFTETLNLKIKQNQFLDYGVRLQMIDATGKEIYSKTVESVINNSIFLSEADLSLLRETNKIVFYKIIVSDNQFNSFIESPWEKLIKL